MTLYARLAVLIAIVLALAAGAWKAYSMGANNVRAEWTAQKLADSETARLREQAMQKTTERIDRDYQTTKASIVASAAITTGKLRELQAIISADNDPTTTSRIDDPYPRLLSECATALAILDGDAKAVAGKAKALQSYAREVCVMLNK